MESMPPVLSFLLLMVSGWVHRHQLLVIELLQAENRLLKGRMRGKRIRFTDAERALLARDCLNRMIFMGQASLRRAVAEYMDHYHRERNHQGLENRLIHAPAVVAANDGAIHRHGRLGGTLNFYYRQAA
jgi:hypothetical protein